MTLLSVCLITYNHVKYIEQAIEGVLMQKVNFSWEIVIADDCSVDGTREILLAYQKKHPELIKLILQEKNVGAYNNWMDLMHYPQSKYIACLDGDDYWTNPLKLQKQVDFLEANPDYAICGHDINVLKDGIITPSDLQSPTTETTYTITDLAKGNLFHTSSVVFRKGLIPQFPSWLHQSPVGDYVLHLLNAKMGKIKFLPEKMAIYRRHDTGVWSSLSELAHFERWVKVLELLLTEPFEEEVIEQLKIQKRKNATLYLKRLLHTDHQLFLQKLKYFSEIDPEFGNEWLLKHYPEYILFLTQSKSFKVAQRLSGIARYFKKK